MRAVCFLAALLASSATVSAELIHFEFDINQQQVVPPTGSPGVGHGICDFDPETRFFSWHIEYGGLWGAPTVAHIHNAPAGVNGPILFVLQGPIGGPHIGQTTLSPASAAQLMAGTWYVAVHTTVLPGNTTGEIRGQMIVPAPGAVGLLAGGAVLGGSAATCSPRSTLRARRGRVRAS